MYNITNINQTTISLLSKSLTIDIIDCLKNAPNKRMKEIVAEHIYNFIDRVEEKLGLNANETLALLSMLSVKAQTTIEGKTVSLDSNWSHSRCGLILTCECMSTDDYDFVFAIEREVGQVSGIAVKDA